MNVEEQTQYSNLEPTTNITEQIIMDSDNNYFITKMSTNLVCDSKTVTELFGNSIHVDDDNVDLIFDNTNYENEHEEYANNLQLYYTLLKKNEPESRSDNLVNIRTLTPILIQKTDNILSTLLFITLDQNHDFRGGRTAGSDSWVTVKTPTFITKVEQIAADKPIEFPMNNSYLSTLINTSFSGLKSLIGLLVVEGEDNIPDLMENGKLNITKIMSENFKEINFIYNKVPNGYDIFMKGCSPDGNKRQISTNSTFTFLSFAQSTWDHGMHDIWNFETKKHIYLVQLTSLSIDVNNILQPHYDIYDYSIIENIVPIFECSYVNQAGASSFLKDNGLTDYKSKETDENELTNIYNKLLEFMSFHEPDPLKRGLVLKFHELGKSGKKGKQLFHDLCKKIGENINPQICERYNIPKTIETCTTRDTAMNVDTKQEEDGLQDLIEKYKTESVDDKIIYKLYGSVNDSNIAVEEKNIIFKNLNRPPVIASIEEQTFGGMTVGGMPDDGMTDDIMDVDSDAKSSSVTDDLMDVDSEPKTTLSAPTTLSVPTSSPKLSSSDFVLNESCGDSVKKTRICSEFISNVVNSTNPECIESYYPTKFQLNSGVIDSSGLGGQNLAQFFAPDIDIYMTIFNNDVQPKLMGAILKLTFLKRILSNAVGVKNNAEVYCHFIYIGFDEINIDCEELTSDNDWQIKYDKYPLALNRLLLYVANHTFYDTTSVTNRLTNFKTITISGDKSWYYFTISTVGPSVKEINTTIQKITKKFFDTVDDENDDLINSIVRVSQKIYKDNKTSLQDIFKPNFVDDTENQRNTFFEAVFFLRIKYLGDKSRCTDSLFLNTNRMVETLQVTLDENAYFTALMNGASTLFSTDLKTCLYFAPYVTPNGKYIKLLSNENAQLKKQLFNSVNPSEPGKLAETKTKTTTSETDKIYSKLFNDCLAQLSSRSGNDPCSWLKKNIKDKVSGPPLYFTALNSMRILNGGIGEEGAVNPYSTVLQYLYQIYTTDDMLDVYKEIINRFDNDLNKIFENNIDIITKLKDENYEVKCSEQKYPVNEDTITKFNTFIYEYSILNKLREGNTGSIEVIKKSFPIEQPIISEYKSTSTELTQPPLVEQNLFGCFQSGIRSLIDTCRELSVKYSGEFAQAQIKQKYNELHDNLYSLLNLPTGERDEFVKKAKKMKFAEQDSNIINDAIQYLIDFFTRNQNDLTPTFISELTLIREKKMPESIKEAGFITYYGQLMSKLSINSKIAAYKQMVTELNNKFSGFVELLNCMKDYNNLFTEISSAFVSNENYSEVLKKINNNLKEIDFETLLKNLSIIYKKIGSYSECINDGSMPELVVKVKATVSSATPTEPKTSSKKLTTLKTSSKKSTISSIPAEVPFVPSEAPVVPSGPFSQTAIRPKLKLIKRPEPTDMDIDEITEERKRKLDETEEVKPEPKKRSREKVRPEITGGEAQQLQSELGISQYQNLYTPITSKISLPLTATPFKNQIEIVGPDKNKFDESYKENKVNIIKNFVDLMTYYNNKYKDLINGIDINYTKIDNINTLMIAITLLAINSELKLYNLTSIDELIHQIKDQLLQSKTPNEVLNIRYFYESFYSKIILIDIYEANINNLSDDNLTGGNGMVGGNEQEEYKDQLTEFLLIKLKEYVKKIYFIYSLNHQILESRIDYVFISNYNILLKIFNELRNKEFIYMTNFSNKYDIFVYLVLFTIRYSNYLLNHLYQANIFENGYNNDFDKIEASLGSDYESYKYILRTPITIDLKPSIEYLNDSLSDTNTKQVYFDTNDNIENALRVYISVFVENLNERNEINKMDVDSSGGKRTRKHKALYYKKFTRNMKHKKNKLTRKKKYNKKRKNTKRN
jgi:hypothetical protein